MWYSKLLRSLILPCGEVLFGSSYTKHLKKIEKTLDLDKQLISFQQHKNLNELLNFAISHSKYYNSLQTDEFSDPMVRLKRFPILTKDILRSSTDLILTEKRNTLICNSTSGSTGVQTNIYLSKEELSLIRAIQTTWWNWAGFEIGEPMLQTGLSTKRTIEKRLKDIFFRIQYLFAFGLTKQNTISALVWSKKRKPFLGGYASSLFVLSELFDGEGVKMKAAVSWGDKLFDHYRKNIEQVFNCKVFETYGTGEGLMLGAQKDLEYLYIMDPYFVVELLDDHGNEVADGEVGHVVVTSLIHKAMPLIRYKVGDLAIKLPRDKYPEKRELGLSLFQKIIGRETDIVETPAGKKLIVHSFTGVFEYFPEIKQFQVYQKYKSEITIRYIPGNHFTKEILKNIQNTLEKLAEECLNIEFVEVDEILPSKSGKPQIVVREN